MPRPRMTEQQERENALKRAIARARVDMDLPLDQDVADTLGLKRATFSDRKKDLYKGFGFDRASQIARQLRFTGRELCEIIGIPYEVEGGT